MNYKDKILTGVLLMGLATSFISCNDWLDVQPKSQVEDTELFKSEAGFKEALAGVYSSMVSESTYTREMLYGAMGILAKEWTYYPSSSYQDLSEYQYDLTTPQSLIASIWARNYNGISNVNNLINHIDAQKNLFGKGNYEIIKGEALALRAFLHFDLLRCFGVSYEVNPNMPAIPYSTDLTYKVFPQLTVKAVAGKVEADLLEAVRLLKDYDPIVTGETITELDDNGYLMNRQVHLNYYAVKGLQARVYMWMHEFGKAEACAYEVAESQAFSWSTMADISSGRDYAFAPEQLFALNDLTLSEIAKNYFNEENSTASFSLDKDVFSEYYESKTDYRYLYLFQSGSGSEQVDRRYMLKYQTSKSTDEDASYYNNKIPLIKLSEMYLILAECKYRDNGEGWEYLNVIRQARSADLLESAPADFYNELIREYRREFIGEGQLFFLYKRLNCPTVIGSSVDMIGQKAYTFPIPLTETEASQRETNR